MREDFLTREPADPHGGITVGLDPAQHLVGPLPDIKRVNGELTYKDALKEALVQEMARDKRVVFYGEDVAD